MTDMNRGGPAFPYSDPKDFYAGMTVWHFILAFALMGEIMSKPNETPQQHAAKAKADADAMLAAIS